MFFFFLSVLVWLQAGKGKDGRVCGYQVVQLEADQKPNNTFRIIIFLSLAVLLAGGQSIPFYPCLTGGSEGLEQRSGMAQITQLDGGGDTNRPKVSSRWREIGQPGAFSPGGSMESIFQKWVILEIRLYWKGKVIL